MQFFDQHLGMNVYAGGFITSWLVIVNVPKFLCNPIPSEFSSMKAADFDAVNDLHCCWSQDNLD